MTSLSTWFLLSCMWMGSPATSPDSTALANARYQSEQMAKAFMLGDYNTFIHFTYPKVVAMVGGSDKMIESVKESKLAMAHQGINITSIAVRDTSRIVHTTSQWQCVIAEHYTIATGQGAQNTTTYLIGISPNQGKSWTFVDAGKKDLETMRKTFPEISPRLVIPPQ